MADFRKAKYSGSLNLAPECGPVLIELDTDAKTATASLEDPASQYTMEGGGGGLEYIIPEQELRFTASSSYTYLTNSGSLDSLADDDQLIIKSVIPDAPVGEPAIYIPSSYYDGTVEGSNAGGAQIEITKDGTGWKMLYSVGAPVYPITLNISAIRGF